MPEVEPAVGVRVQVPLPLLTIVPWLAVTFIAVRVLPSTSELVPINCALVKVIAVSSVPLKVTAAVTGASFTAAILTVVLLGVVKEPSLKF